MTTRGALRKGWCPGALRPMETGDGLLVRIRSRAGSFSLDALETIADAAGRFGSGEIDLTNRANLQLRGLTIETYDDAIAALAAAGLLDDDPAIEAVRNVIVDPLSGIDPARTDVRPLALELEQLLAERTELHALPAKFGFKLEGRSEQCSGPLAADISLTALDEETGVIRLDGDATTVARVELSASVPALARLVTAFVAMNSATPSLRRMRDAVKHAGSAELFAQAGLTAEAIDANSPSGEAWTAGPIGPNSAPFAIAIGLPFGRISAHDLRLLCEAAAAAGCTDVRPSSRRAFVFGVAGADADALLNCAKALGLIIGTADPRIGVDVCPGMPACRNATTQTRADAERLLAAIAQRGLHVPSIHISGCDKGCARRSAAAWTLVARNGAYAVIQDGTVDDAPHITRIAPAELATLAAQLFTRGLS